MNKNDYKNEYTNSNSESNEALSWFEKNTIKARLLEHMAVNPLPRKVASPFYKSFDFVSYSRVLVPVSLMLFIILPFGGLYIASANSLPDQEFLWRSKVSFDNLRYNLTIGQERKAKLALELTEKRLDEVALVIKKNNLTPAKAETLTKEIKRQAINVENFTKSIKSEEPLLAVAYSDKLKQTLSVNQNVIQSNSRTDADLNIINDIQTSVESLNTEIASSALSANDNLQLARNKASELQEYLTDVSVLAFSEIKISEVDQPDAIFEVATFSAFTEQPQPEATVLLKSEEIMEIVPEPSLMEASVALEANPSRVTPSNVLDSYKNANLNLQNALEMIKLGQTNEAIKLLDESLLEIKTVLKNEELKSN